jgi:hypothetical protein
MKIHAIQTGTVAITTAWREGVGHGRRRLLHTIVERNWTEPLPIYAFAIEHPEGVIVVDTRESARASLPGYFPRWHPVFRFAVREWVDPEQEIGPQLERLGIRPQRRRPSGDDASAHPTTPAACSTSPTRGSSPRAEIAYASGLRGQLRGYPNTRWPAWFELTPLDLEPEPFGPFPQSLRLTEAGDVTVVPLPGHSPGQLGGIRLAERRVIQPIPAERERGNKWWWRSEMTSNARCEPACICSMRCVSQASRSRAAGRRARRTRAWSPRISTAALGTAGVRWTTAG